VQSGVDSITLAAVLPQQSQPQQHAQHHWDCITRISTRGGRVVMAHLSQVIIHINVHRQLKHPQAAHDINVTLSFLSFFSYLSTSNIKNATLSFSEEQNSTASISDEQHFTASQAQSTSELSNASHQLKIQFDVTKLSASAFSDAKTHSQKSATLCHYYSYFQKITDW
jgi:hypothetical protein